jgi:hypothetical protein
MTRLPIPGQDDGNWGEILNDFLDVSHNGNGTLKPSGATASSGAKGQLLAHGSDQNSFAWIDPGMIDTTNPPLPLGVASPGTGSSGAAASDHVHAMPQLLDLTDVDSGDSPANGQSLIWNAASGKWISGAPSVTGSSPLWLQIDNGEITLPRIHTDDSGTYGSTPASGEMRLTYFRAQTSGSRGTVRFQTASTAASSSTLARVGLYSVDTASGNLTLMAACANQTCTLSASVSLTAGTTYAIGILQIASTPASLAGQWFNGTFLGATPKLAQKVTGLSDLPSSVTSGLSDDQFPIYCEVV